MDAACQQKWPTKQIKTKRVIALIDFFYNYFEGNEGKVFFNFVKSV